MSSVTVFPLPPLKPILQGTVDMPDDKNKETIEQNFKDNIATLTGYQQHVQDAYLEVWKLAADGMLNLKALLNFFL